MTKIRTLVIDDEPLACEEMRFLMQGFADFDVLATPHTWKDAQHLIQETQPDLLLLDIALGQQNGFELLESLDYAPEVIFVTAHNQYALKAFEYNALHYLLKPIDEALLRKALQRVQETWQNRQGRQGVAPPQGNLPAIDKDSKVFIKDGEQCFFVPLQDIYLIETVGNYSRVFFKDKKPLLHKSLNLLEEKLPQDIFFRANRSQIINLHHIKAIHPNFKSKLSIYLQQGNEIEISVRQSIRFKELMSL